MSQADTSHRAKSHRGHMSLASVRALHLVGSFSLALAVLQFFLYVGGPDVYRTFATPEWLVQFRIGHGIYSLLVEIFIAGVFALMSMYAFSAAGTITTLPRLETGLAATAAIYFVRGCLIIPQALWGAFLPSPRMLHLVSSAVAAVLGLVTAFIAIRYRLHFKCRGAAHVVQNKTVAADHNAIGIALSGGGHRATLFGLGALLYLADTGIARHITTIASVSAGSITNAYLATVGRSALESGEEFERHVAYLTKKIAGDRVWWKRSLTLLIFFGASFLVMLCVLITHVSIWLLAAPLAGLLILALFIGPRSGGSLWAWSGTWLWVVLVGVSLMPGVFLWRTAQGELDRLAALALTALVTGTVYFMRGHFLRWALGRTIAPVGSSGMNHLKLEQISGDVDHVICGTELHAGRHAYFGRDFVYTGEFGLGRPNGLPLTTALQASASFPLVFPVCILNPARHAFRFADAQAMRHASLVLSDGGIFDNLADAWQLEAGDRAERLKELSRQHRTDAVDRFIERLNNLPKSLVVVDAGPPAASKRTTFAAFPFITELWSAARAANVAYENATLTRGRDLDVRFAAQNPRGAVVASARSPLDVVRAILESKPGEHPSDEMIGRARCAERYLETHFPNVDFASFPRLSIASGTYFTAVGADHAAHLLFHGYVQAMVTLHVVLGYPLLSRVPDPNDFEHLARGKQRQSRPTTDARSAPVAVS